jgi:hypothetical protein
MAASFGVQGTQGVHVEGVSGRFGSASRGRRLARILVLVSWVIRPHSSTMELTSEALELVPTSPSATPEGPAAKPPRRKHRPTRPQLLMRRHLGRSSEAKMFDAISTAIAQDLGGESELSTIQKHLVEAFAGAAIHVNNLTARLLRGDQVDIVAHSQAISTMVRVAQRVGVRRMAKPVEGLYEELERKRRERLEAEKVP